MKKLMVSLSLIFVFSCAQLQERPKAVSKEMDVLSEESFMRYGDIDLQGEEFLVDCHRFEMKTGLGKAKASYNSQKNNPDYWNNIGTCYYLKSDFQKAMFFYKVANDLAIRKTKKNHPAAVNNIGLIYLEQQKFNDAVGAFESALKGNPRLLTPRFNLSQVYALFNLYGLAIEHLVYLANKNPRDELISASLGDMYFLSGDFKKAVVFYEKLQPKSYWFAQTINNHAGAHHFLGNDEKAKELLKNYSAPDASDFDKKFASTLKEQIEKNLEYEKQLAEQKERDVASKK